MNILEIAIQHEGGISALAKALGIKPNVVSMWRNRKQLSAAWTLALAAKYKRQINAASKAAA